MLELDQQPPQPGPVTALQAGSRDLQVLATLPRPIPAKQHHARDARVVLLSLSDISELPVDRNSRNRHETVSLEELANSIRQHGLLQPLLVRPLTEAEGTDLPSVDFGQRRRPIYEVIVGNRRFKAARLAGLTEVDCIVRITDADEAFVLNVVANLQRRELSGRERARAITLLASLADESGLPLGVRAISRRTGLSPATISMWLNINRRPALKAALEEERLDIGRTMKLVRAPNQELPGLIDKARTMSQAELGAVVALLNQDAGVIEGRSAAANAHRAALALNALDHIDAVQDSVRTTLQQVHARLQQLLGPCCSDTAHPMR